MAWEEIVDVTMTSQTNRIDITNLNITKDDFIKIHMTVNASAGYLINMQANDITTGYVRQALGVAANGTTVVADRTTAVQPISQGGPPGNQAFAYLKLSQNDKYNFFTNYNIGNSADVRIFLDYITSTTSFSSGINKLSFIGFPSGAVGSRIQIYRLTAEKVADITVTSNTTQVNITGLDIKKGDEYLLVSDMVSSGSSNSQINLCVNNNTNLSGYYRQVIVASGGGTGAERVNRAEITTLIQNARSLGYSHIKLSNIGAYTSQSYGTRRMGESILELENNSVSSTAENITSITQLNLFSSVSNAIGSGTRFQLYKLYEGGN